MTENWFEIPLSIKRYLAYVPCRPNSEEHQRDI
jgi:hypothetical protein